ncbi:MAG: response regulator [Deltaproteobacteria bacterium]|jgi:DNA-binding NarL/FixJ family response regulator|nr:response regulator [Deltaproteobacteria bacterium]
MSASVLLLIDNEGLRAKLSGYLTGDRYVVSEGPSLKSSAEVEATIAHIASVNPDLAIMDYVGEDEASVKVLQHFADQDRRTDFIFVDSYLQSDRDKIMLAFNEGVGAFLSPDISSVGLVNYVARVLSGPCRFRGDYLDDDSRVSRPGDESLSRVRSKLDGAQKLIAYLLSTPLTAQPRKTLVLSDSPYQRELLKKYLEDHNFVVLTASNIDDAVALTLAEKPRVVISDYALEEGKTGVDFCQTLKLVHKYNPCYFVVCTANMDKFSAIMTPGNGVDDCVLKPSPTSSLNEFLASVSAGLLL